MKTQSDQAGQFVTALLCVGLTLFSSGCAHSHVYPVSFERSEADLLSRLRIDKRKLSSSGGASAHADRTLARYMTMEDYSVELQAASRAEGVLLQDGGGCSDDAG